MSEPSSVSTPNYLHLDGVVSFIGVLGRYDWQITLTNNPTTSVSEVTAKKDSSFKPHYLCRVSIIFQTAILCVTNSIKQCVRGCSFFVASIFCCSREYFVFALKDFISVIVQLVALPILGLIAIVSPKFSGELARILHDQLNMDCRASYPCKKDAGAENQIVRRLSPYVAPLQPVEKDCNRVFRMIMYATAPVQCIAYHIQGFISAFLSLDIGPEQIFFPFFLGLMPLYSAFNWDSEKQAASTTPLVQGIAIGIED